MDRLSCSWMYRDCTPCLGESETESYIRQILTVKSYIDQDHQGILDSPLARVQGRTGQGVHGSSQIGAGTGSTKSLLGPFPDSSQGCTQPDRPCWTDGRTFLINVNGNMLVAALPRTQSVQRKMYHLPRSCDGCYRYTGSADFHTDPPHTHT